MNIPFLSANNLAVGIDIGSHSVKVCQLKRDNENYVIQAVGSATLPEGAVEEGFLHEPKVVGPIIKKLLANLRIRNKKIGFSVSGYSVIVKKIVLDPLSESELEEHIAAEAEQYIPFDIKDVYLDFQDLQTNKNKNERTDVILVAAKRDVVDAYLEMFAEIGLSAVVVDVDNFAFENAYTQQKNSLKNAALIDIGATSMSINILANGISVVARDINTGSQLLTNQLQDLLDLDFQAAENVKLGKQDVTTDQDLIKKAFTTICTQWVLEVKKSVDIYQINHPDSPVEKLLLSGGGAKIKNLPQFLEQETDIPTEIFSPFSDLRYSEKKIDPNYLETIGPEFAIAAGLAQRSAEL